MDMETVMTARLIRQKFDLLGPALNERTRRQWAATEAFAVGRGGITLVATALSIAPNTIRSGIRELRAQHKKEEEPLPPERIRRAGGGRKTLTEQDSRLLPDLNALVDPVTRGDPESSLLWTSKSAAKLGEELRKKGHVVSDRTVDTLLHAEGYSLQSNRKAREGMSHPDRDAQFRYIAETVRAFQDRNQPVISVDTKKKELVGNFKNAGREWKPKGKPVEVNTHDFKDEELGKVIPYGVYDILRNEGWVNVGIDRETAQFAVESIRRWWHRMGKERYPKARALLVTADCGGGNGVRRRLWKRELQRLADETGLTIAVRHFPPGTSKWNKIEHRLFSFITKNWRGRPLLSRATVVNLIAHTKTEAGLRVEAALDTHAYPKGIKVTDAEMASLRLRREAFHGEWNYRIEPQQ
jgi:hypothetical protein